MKKLYSLTVRGNQYEWVFDIRADSQEVETWREDGLEIDEVVNTMPYWVVLLGLTDVWCWLQDHGIIPG